MSSPRRFDTNAGTTNPSEPTTSMMSSRWPRSHRVVRGAICLVLLVAPTACIFPEPPSDLAPLPESLDHDPKLNDVPPRPAMPDTLVDRRSLAMQLMETKTQEEALSDTLRQRMLAEAPATRTPSSLEINELPGKFDTPPPPPPDEVARAYIDALIFLERDPTTLNALLFDLVLTQNSFLNSNAQNRRLELIYSQADSEFGGALNYPSLYDLINDVLSTGPINPATDGSVTAQPTP